MFCQIKFSQYHPQASSNPCFTEYVGSYPKIVFLFLIDANECGTSPSRVSPYLKTTLAIAGSNLVRLFFNIWASWLKEVLSPNATLKTSEIVFIVTIQFPFYFSLSQMSNVGFSLKKYFIFLSVMVRYIILRPISLSAFGISLSI